MERCVNIHDVDWAKSKHAVSGSLSCTTCTLSVPCSVCKPVMQNDITSLGMCLCRHGHIGFLMNSVTGERHAYATLFVKAILSCIISSLLFVWYDINCRWAASFLKWLASQGAALREKAARLQYPLPRMHFWAHRLCSSLQRIRLLLCW